MRMLKNQNIEGFVKFDNCPTVKSCSKLTNLLIKQPPTIRTVNVEKRLDTNFFAPPTASVHYKGRHCIPSGLTAATNVGYVFKFN